MSTELEHEIVPAIRGWLAASSGVDVPTGLSREEARRRARELLAAIAAGSIAPGQVEVVADAGNAGMASDGLEDNAMAVIRFANGLLAQMHLGYAFLVLSLRRQVDQLIVGNAAPQEKR